MEKASNLPVTYFSVSFSGEIEGITGADSSQGLCLSWQIVTGPDWQVLKGDTSGLTQTSVAKAGAAVWNFPISIQLRSTNPSGWPRLVFTLFAFDALRRKIVTGYGSLLLPCHPGRQSRMCRIHAPAASSAYVGFMGKLTGKPPTLTDTTFVAQGEGRDSVRVRTVPGEVGICLNVMWKDHRPFDLSIN